MEATHLIGERDLLAQEISHLLRELGAGRTSGVAYDTAWVARLAPRYPSYGFDRALDWLRRSQYPDGTWGAPLLHYHDRFISTLAAIVALREVGDDPRDPRRVKRGEDALWKLVGKLGRDDSDTVGFPILSAALAEEATRLGLEVPLPPVRFAASYQKKVKALLSQPHRNWRASPLAHSLEALYLTVGDNDEVFESNFSIGVSLSATAGYLLRFENEAALAYIRDAMERENTGAAPALAPIDTFEIVWSLNHLLRAQAVSLNDPEVRQAIAYLWKLWSQDVGIGTSSCFSVPDIDDTAACFTILRWAGYPAQQTVFGAYEQADHFCCFHNETNLSMSAHIRLLLALRQADDDPQRAAWIEKVLSAVQRSDENGSFWWDKWHSSPYYVTAASLSALQGVADDLAHSRLKWILRTQNDDGGWGYLGESTPEETAYCLEALLDWDRTVERLAPSVLDEAAAYLRGHISDRQYVPLWIGKSLYTPRLPVKAAVLGALHSYWQQA